MPTKKNKKLDLKIGFDARYVQSGFPGIGRYVYSLAQAMGTVLAANDSNSCLSLIYNPALTTPRHDLIALSQNFPTKVQLVTTAARPISLKEQWQLPWLARSQKFSLWHAPYYIRPYFLPLPTVLTAHDVTSARLPASLPSQKARLAFAVTTRLAFFTSSRIICGSQAAANDISELYHLSPAKIKVILHGVEAQFQPADLLEQAAFRAELKLPPAYILYVGINKPHKNLLSLLEAFKQFRQRTHSETVLILAGREDPRYSQALHQHAAALGLSQDGTVRFWGEVNEPDLPKLYAAADFLVLPSLYEGFGLPILEAMASGCPVTCANNSSLPEVAGDAALMFEATQTGQIADALEQLATQPILRAELRERGLLQASTFSWQRAAEQTLEVYREATSGKN